MIIPGSIELGSQDSLAGKGVYTSFPIPNVQGVPEVSASVPAGSVFFLKSFSFILSADVALADLRRLWFFVRDPLGVEVITLGVDALQLPDTVRRYTWALGVADAYNIERPLFNDSTTRQGLPDELYLSEGWEFGVQYELAAALDTFSDISYTASVYSA